MHKKLTITLDERVYEGLHRVVGRRHISRFIESLVQPHVVAADLDPVAVRATAENAALNGFEGVVGTSAASIESLATGPPFDCIVANIVADPIIAGAAEIRRRLRPGGQAIVGGIIDRREADVTDALRQAGLSLVRVLAEEEWRALLLQ